MKARFLFLCAAAACFLPTVHAQTAAPVPPPQTRSENSSETGPQANSLPPHVAPKAPQLPYEKYTLQNGLEVILLENHRLPLVSTNLWYHVGPLEEREGRTGFAHLFEHMMFEGSKHVGEKAHIKYLESSGASDINGTTDFDRTNYFDTLPSNELEIALWLESDRMGFLLDTLDATKLANQRDVVRNERRQTHEGEPYGLVEEAMFHDLFPKTHPYYANIIGSHADIEAARLNDVREFFRQYYIPNNATLAIVGDFKKSEVKALVEKYFGPIPPGPPVARTEVTTPAITTQRRETVTDTVQLPRVYIAWLTPKAYTQEDAAGDIGSSILGGGKSSRLYQSLVYKQQIAQSVQCYHQSLKLTSPFVCELTAKPNVKPEQLEKAAWDEIAKLGQSGPTQAEVDRARNKEETALISQLQRFGDEANTLNNYNQYTGDPGYLPKDIARYEAVTAASVQNFAQTYLGANQSAVLYGVPGEKKLNDVPRAPAEADAKVKIEPAHGAEFEAQQAWRDTPPKPGPDPILHLPQPAKFTLANGLDVYLVEQHELPLVSAAMISIAGADTEAVEQAGLAGFSTALLTEGTATRSATQIADFTDQIGATLAKGVTYDDASLAVSLLSNNIAPAMDLVSDLYLHPAFAQKDVDRIRRQRLVTMMQLKDQPVQLAFKVGLKGLYGPANRYGYQAIGTEDTIKNFQPADLEHFWKTHATPHTSALILAGDLTIDSARSLAEKYFGSWNAPGTRTPPPATPPQPKRAILLVDQPNAPQSQLIALGVGIPRSSPDYAKVSVMNNVLGGLFASRLNMNLREKNGYTYGASTTFDYFRGNGPFLAIAGVRTEVTAPAAKELFSELSRIRTDPPTAEEVRLAKESIIRSMPAEFETIGSMSSQIAELWIYQLPMDYYLKLPGQIAAVDGQQAAEAARRYIDPEHILLAVAGDKAKIEGGLRDLNLGPIEMWNTDGYPVGQPRK